jgi:nicotinamide-nucleotide amidase
MPLTTAQEIAELLARLNLRLVLAESCTGGKAASLITEVPGISQWFCGSAVTYREDTKKCWLGVSDDVLGRFTAESQESSDAMAMGTLALTPEAAICSAITGHLGPGVGPAVDGLIFVSLAVRIPVDERAISLSSDQDLNDLKNCEVVWRQSGRLLSKSRVDRQKEAADKMLEAILWFLNRIDSGTRAKWHFDRSN